MSTPIPVKGKSDSHTLQWDPPAALTAALRWTCTECGAALLDYQGTIYGSATEHDCAEEKAFWGAP